eukprot:5054382-Pleurochrysis_carterae.AAC.7
MPLSSAPVAAASHQWLPHAARYLTSAGRATAPRPTARLLASALKSTHGLLTVMRITHAHSPRARKRARRRTNTRMPKYKTLAPHGTYVVRP